jgi:uncharacterized membrane protein
MRTLSPKENRRKWVKRILIAGIILLIAGAAGVWYIFNIKFDDTTQSKADYTLNAMDLIKEFQKSDSVANKKYSEQIITVNGRISELETADTATVNVKMVDTLTNAYIIFTFQQQHLAEAKMLKEGDSVSIKGSCSGGKYSSILDTESITFKRCAINKN